MENYIPDINRQIYAKSISNILFDKYSKIGPLWVSHQHEWCNEIYTMFRDHDKFLIVIYLVKKTLDFYSRNFIKLTYDEFYSSDSIEIEKFNVIELAKNIDIPKESTRRKVVELENKKVIKRLKKKLIVDRSAFKFVKPEKSIKRISRFLSLFSGMLVNEKILKTSLTSVELERVIKKNFSYVWKLYYEMQIPMMVNYKKIFKDLETFHIYGTCVVAQHLFSKKLKKQQLKRNEFLSLLYESRDIQGINAMSISDITGIPRATVVRKLKNLIKLNYLIIDNKKHYRITSPFMKKLAPKQTIVLNHLANFATKIYNLAIL